MGPLALMAIGGGTSLLGGLLGARGNRRLRNAANSLTLDQSELQGAYGDLEAERAGFGDRAMRDARNTVGYDPGMFQGSLGIRGAGRNSFGTLMAERQQQADMQMQNAALSRYGDLERQNLAARTSLGSALQQGRLGLLGIRSGMLQQAAAQGNQLTNQFMDVGGIGIGMGLEGWMGKGDARAGGGNQVYGNFRKYGRDFQNPFAPMIDNSNPAL